MMASLVRGSRKRKKANCDTDGRITKYFHVITPSTEISSPGSGSTGSTNNPTGPNDAEHVSDIDTGSSDSDEPENGRCHSADAGPSEMEQPPGVQPDSGCINDPGLKLRL